MAIEELGVISDVLMAGGVLFNSPEIEAAGIAVSALDKYIEMTSEPSEGSLNTVESHAYGSEPSHGTAGLTSSTYHINDAVANLHDENSSSLGLEPGHGLYSQPNFNGGLQGSESLYSSYDDAYNAHQNYAFNGQDLAANEHLSTQSESTYYPGYSDPSVTNQQNPWLM